MRLPTSDAVDMEDLKKRSSDDILKIEISGPDEHQLSVVDVPGLFHCTIRISHNYDPS